jgi:hypothetical protein
MYSVHEKVPLSTEWKAGWVGKFFWTFEEQKNLLPPTGF